MCSSDLRWAEFKTLVHIGWEFLSGFRELHFIGPCVTVFGSARFPPGHPYYELGRTVGAEIARLGFNVMTGGGPGIMEAANRGAFDVGCKSIGLNIKLPSEQQPNPFITPELCFQFKYFALRKFHFILRAAAVVLFPGGFGTLDEMFETLTLRQTHRMQPVPIILFGREYWSKVINFQQMADEGVISDEHLELFSWAETADDAWRQIVEFHEHRRQHPA